MKRKAAALTLVLTCFFSILTGAIATDSTKENSWETLTPLPETSNGMRVAAANGKIYAMSSTRNFEYDPELNTWTMKTPMPTPRQWCTIAVYQNKIYTIGGRAGSVEVDGGVASNAIEVYDPSNDTWKILSPKPSNISDVYANVVNGKIYLIGGFDRQFPSLSTNGVYDVAQDSWRNKTPMPYPVSYFASGVVDNKIYIIGNRTQIYDPETDSWSLGRPIPIPVFFAAIGATTGVLAPKKIYVIGGTTFEDGMFSGGTSLVQVYDPKDNTWTVGEPMPTARLQLSIAVIADQIYALYGSSAMAFTPWIKANERYTPLGYGTVPPGVDVASPENSTYTSGDVSLVFTVDKPAAWMGYSLDRQDSVTIGGNVTLTGLFSGLHNVTVYAKDELGNVGVSETVWFNVTEPFPIIPLAVSVALVAVVVAVLLVYFKKRKG